MKPGMVTGMKFFRMLKIVVVLTAIGMALAATAGTAYAVNGIKSSYPPGVQPLSAGGGAGTGTTGSGFNIPATGGQVVGGGQAPGGNSGMVSGLQLDRPAVNPGYDKAPNYEWAMRCTGIASPGNDPLCRLDNPQNPYYQGKGGPGMTGQVQSLGTGSPMIGTGQGTGGGASTLLATGGPQIGAGAGQAPGGTSGTLLGTGGPQIGTGMGGQAPGGTSGNLVYQLRPGELGIGGVQK